MNFIICTSTIPHFNNSIQFTPRFANFFIGKQIASYDIKLNITVSICYVNYHIVCLKCSMLAATYACVTSL